MNNFIHPSLHIGQNHNIPAVPFNTNRNAIPRKELTIINDQKQATKTTCIVIDSRDRNTTQYPNTNNFAFHFFPSDTFVGAALYEQYHNIKSIRLVECLVPDFDTTSIPYLTLVIPELDKCLSGTNDTLKKAFTVLLPDREFSGILHCRTDGMPFCKKEYFPPKSSFSKFTLTFFNPDGTLHTFGTGEVTLIFEIETVVYDINAVMKPLIN